MTQEQIEAVRAEVAGWIDVAKIMQRERDEAKAQLATLRAAIAEAIRRADSPSRYAECFSYEAAKYITEPLRNLDQPDTPSERIMSDKDRENPVEGAHPTQPEGEDALVEKPCPLCDSSVTKETGFADNFKRGEYQYASCSECSYQADWHDHVASRGLVRGEGV